MLRVIVKSSRIYHWLFIILNACVMEFSLSQTWHSGFLIGVALCFAATYGFLINDLRDTGTDRINGRDRMQNLSKKDLVLVKYISILFFVASLVAASSIGLNGALVTLFVLVSLFVYSFYIRKTVFANIFCALICTSPLWSIYFIEPVQPDLLHIGIILSAFIIILAREVVFDTKDRKGDEKDGRNSLPILIGLKNTKFLVFSLLSTGLVFLAFGLFSIFFQVNFIYKFLIIGLFVGFSMLFIVPCVAIYSKETNQSYNRFSSWTRYGMLILPLFLLISIL